jgi:hypothetical protein
MSIGHINDITESYDLIGILIIDSSDLNANFRNNEKKMEDFFCLIVHAI